MNPPTDPLQLLIYGAGTVLVVFALKIWDRRRDGKLQRTADAALQHAADAAEHAGTAAAAAGRVEQKTASRASGEQAEEILQVGHDTTAALIGLARQLGRIEAKVAALGSLPERVGRLETEVDALILPGAVRRRQEYRP